MSKGHALLQSGSAGRVLNECQALRLMLQLREFHLYTGPPAIAGMKQRGLAVERHVAEHLVGKSFVDNYDFGAQVSCHSSQSGAVLGRLNLEVGISKEGGHRAQHHRSGKGGHCGNALRHDDDHPIAGSHTMVAKCSGLKVRAAAELREVHGFAFVFVDPRSNKWTICGSRIECLNKIAESVHAAVTVSGEKVREHLDRSNHPPRRATFWHARLEYAIIS